MQKKLTILETSLKDFQNYFKLLFNKYETKNLIPINIMKLI